jgi:iron-sulfur cluster assembly accessory protein
MNAVIDIVVKQARQRAQNLPTEAQLKITSAAADHIQRTLADQQNALGLRVGVAKSGCSGFGYVMDVAQSVEPNDYVFVTQTPSGDDVFIVCDDSSFSMLKGSTLDYVVNGLSRLLQFNNPNVVDSCGCGESFTIKEENATHA